MDELHATIRLSNSIPTWTHQYADTLSRLYEEVPKEEVRPDEMADGIEDNEDEEFSQSYLNSIEFQTDEDIQNELDQEDNLLRQRFFKPPSIARTLSVIPHVMAKERNEPKRRKCKAGINWKYCRSKEGCPYRYSSAFPTHSKYTDEERYNAQFESDDETVRPDGPDDQSRALVLGSVSSASVNQHDGSRVSNESETSSSVLTEIAPDFFVRLDGDGYPEWWEWVYGPGTASIEAGTVEEPDSRTLRIVNGRIVQDTTSNAITRSRWSAQKSEETGEGSGMEVSTYKEPVELALDEDERAPLTLYITPPAGGLERVFPLSFLKLHIPWG
jgi:hypothetical protein